MDSSPAESSSAAAAANKKRKRVSRACDACFAKKDRCDGVQPICKVCKNLGRPCTYNRPERKRGPSQGVRQRLEGQIESLESLLGYVVDTYPQVCCEAIKHLRLDEAEDNLANSSRLFSNGFNTPSPSSPASAQAGNIFPKYSKVDAREIWRVSSFAKALAPSLSLDLGADEDDDDLNGYDGWRTRIDEAKRARARLRSGITSNSPSATSTMLSQQHQQYIPQHHQHSHHHIQAPANEMQHHYSQPNPINAGHLHQFSHPTPPPPIQFPPYSHQYPSKKIQQQGRPPPGFASPSLIPQQPPTFKSDSGHHPPPYQQLQQQYNQLQRPMDTSSYSPSVPLQSPMDNFSQQGGGSSFDGETDALAYALGLTSYTSSSTNDTFGARAGGMMMPISSHQQPWGSLTGTSTDQQGDQSYQSMHSMEHQQQGSSSQDEGESAALTYFGDLDLNIGNQASDNHNMSILHQLGLQGALDMPTPINTGGDHIDSKNAPGASGSSIDSGSSNSHQGHNQWLHPIRGI